MRRIQELLTEWTQIFIIHISNQSIHINILWIESENISGLLQYRKRKDNSWHNIYSLHITTYFSQVFEIKMFLQASHFNLLQGIKKEQEKACRIIGKSYCTKKTTNMVNYFLFLVFNHLTLTSTRSLSVWTVSYRMRKALPREFKN